MLSLSSERSMRQTLRTMRPVQWMPLACRAPYSSFCLSLGLKTCKNSNHASLLVARAGSVCMQVDIVSLDVHSMCLWAETFAICACFACCICQLSDGCLDLQMVAGYHISKTVACSVYVYDRSSPVAQKMQIATTYLRSSGYKLEQSQLHGCGAICQVA